MTLEKIFSSKHKFAIILRDGHEPEGTMFYTDKDDSLQLGTIKHNAGYLESPHIHKKRNKVIIDVIESLHIVYGKVVVDFFEDGKEFSSVTLNPGDTAFLMEGTHRIRVIESFKGVKVKQGPYLSLEEDKEFVEIKK